MKNLFKSLMLVIMAMIFALSVIGCNKTPTESGKESGEESVYIPVPEPIVGAGENGEYNLQKVLDVLSPVFDNNFVNVSLSMESVTDMKGAETSNTIVANLNLKKTVRGYDVIASLEMTGSEMKQEVNKQKLEIYYVDGRALVGNVMGENVAYVKYPEVPTFNGLINQLNVMIATNPEYSAIYHEYMPMVEQIGELIGTLDSKNIDLSGEADIAEAVEGAIAYIVNVKDVICYDYILGLFGVDPTSAEEVAQFEDGLKSYLAQNPSIDDIIHLVVDTANQMIIEEARAQAEANGVEFDPATVMTIDLAMIMGMVESEIGMSALELYQALSTQLDLSAVPAPTEEDTYQTYLHALLGSITVDDIAGMLIQSDDGVEYKFTDLVDMCIADAKEITVGEVVNVFVNLIAEELNSQGKVEGDVEDGNAIVEPVDIFEILETVQIDLEMLYGAYSFKTDEYGRPTELTENVKLVTSFNMQVDETQFERVPLSVQEVLAVKISYKEPTVKFVIPANLWEVAADGQHKENTESASATNK